MRLSKIQLLNAQILRVAITPKSQSAGGAPSGAMFHHSTNLPEFEHMIRIKEVSNLSKAVSAERPELKGLGYRAELGIRVNEDHKNTFPYLMEVIVSGVFFAETMMTDGVEAPENPDLVTQYAASILYSQVRDIVSGLTARMRWGQFSLPIASFMDLTFDQAHVAETPPQVVNE